MNKNIGKKIIATSLLVTTMFGTTACSIYEPEPINSILPESFTSIFEHEDIVMANKNDTNSYMYNKLTTDQKKLYDKFLVAFENFDTEIETKTENTEIETIYESIMSDRPEMFYVSGYVLDGTTLYPNYLYSKEETEDYIAQIDEIATDWLKDLDIKNSSDYEISKYCFDVVIDNVKYVEESETDQNLVDSMIFGEGVSSSYTAAYVYLMQKCGIESFAVKGTLSDEDHTWAATYLDGQMYATDVMNGDYNYLDAEGNEQYMTDYCCLNMIEEIIKNYTPSILFKDINYDGSAANYYIKNDLLLTGYNEYQIKEIFDKEIAAGNNVIKLTFSSYDTMNTALFQLRDNQRLAQFYNGNSAGFLSSERFYYIIIVL